ncbi:MAG: CAAX prenyl protease-related protein [Desulfobacteraceae bacterium 4572_35.1]|nr:MAG: CAAX prenyl protease-related protein [Desulfobacteraceae bacterium 4572_35.1]
MARFYTKNWFPYTFPFLLCFSISQATIYLPSWYLHLSIAKIFIGGTLLWMWREKFSAELNAVINKKQFILALLFGIIGFIFWIATSHYGLVQFHPNNIPSEWNIAIKTIVIIILMSGGVIVLPIISEIFWRSFMLRYLIEQDFKSLPIGKFQLFSFLGVVVLSAIPSSYPVAVAAISVTQNLLLIWQKNLKCCILSSVMTNILLATYLLLNNYQLP